MLLEILVLFSATTLQSNGANVRNMSKGDPAKTVAGTRMLKTLVASTRSGSSPASGVDFTVIGGRPIAAAHCTAKSKTHASRSVFAMSMDTFRCWSTGVVCTLTRSDAKVCVRMYVVYKYMDGQQQTG